MIVQGTHSTTRAKLKQTIDDLRVGGPRKPQWKEWEDGDKMGLASVRVRTRCGPGGRRSVMARIFGEVVFFSKEIIEDVRHDFELDKDMQRDKREQWGGLVEWANNLVKQAKESVSRAWKEAERRESKSRHVCRPRTRRKVRFRRKSVPELLADASRSDAIRDAWQASREVFERYCKAKIRERIAELLRREANDGSAHGNPADIEAEILRIRHVAASAVYTATYNQARNVADRFPGRKPALQACWEICRKHLFEIKREKSGGGEPVTGLLEEITRV